MKLIFAGTPVFAARALEAILDAGHDVALVLTQPDRPAGRGMKLTPSPVKALAQSRGLRVEQPLSLKTPEAQALVADVGAEVMVVAAYGLILPAAVLAMPARGCLNIHASLLPRWRGAAPIQRAIESGDARTGITIMQMDVGLDTGAMLSTHPVDIGPADTASTLHDALAQSGARAIVEALADLDALPRTAQPEEGVTYAAKVGKEEGRIDWTLPADLLARRVRAFNPAPGCHTLLAGAPLKVWMAEALEGRGEPGLVARVDADGVVVGTGDGLLRLTIMQAAGGRRLPARDFLAGHPVAAGMRLGV
ncbi:methionyl-tRNA formyltransferase [Paludibacterium paludis]|uniref:Methionyl-tRNA formyltransferase n=1 Tax=Paludibacterium paludis TaxID=1225769 RepID=A0A918U839_9NEIS|nr:methionyl-tRNA formyltransferase [Paludibacterium paludis]GGY09767.1 methionyl-tRNA formyltransferase [Paludibacterium paludis]